MEEEKHAVWEEYLELIAKKPPYNTRREFELEKLWPITKEAVIKSANQVFTKKKLKGLLITVGLTAEPIAATILGIQPEYVCFIHTKESEKTLNTVVQLVDLPIDKYRKYEVNLEDIHQMYNEMKQALRYLIFDKGFKENEIGIDATGGGKTMPFVAGLIGQNFDLAFVYVANKEWSKEARRPVAGTEYFVYQPHLAQAFPDGAYYKVIQFFENLDFGSAKTTLKQIMNPYNRMHALTELILDAFIDWERFDYEEATKKIVETKEMITKNFPKASTNQINLLLNEWENYLVETNKLFILKAAEIIRRSAIMLHEKNNAVIAVILGYSGIEYLLNKIFEEVLCLKRSEITLEKISQNECIMKTFNLKKEDLAPDKILQEWEALLEKQQMKDKSFPTVFSLIDSLQLLFILDKKLRSKHKLIGKMRNYAKLRNKLVHEFIPPSPGEARGAVAFYKELFETLIDSIEQAKPEEEKLSDKAKKYVEKLPFRKNISEISEWLKIENLEQSIYQ